MKYSDKQAAVCGSFFLLGAAFFSIAYIIRLFNFGFIQSGLPLFLFMTGHIFYSIYGISCVLIPIFLFTAALMLFLPNWTIKRSMYLAVSVVPFYTVVAAERMCHFVTNGTAPLIAAMKIIGILLATVLLIVIEYLMAGIAFDAYLDISKQKGKRRFKKTLLPDFRSENNDDNFEEENYSAGNTEEENVFLTKSEAASQLFPAMEAENSDDSAPTHKNVQEDEDSREKNADVAEESFQAAAESENAACAESTAEDTMHISDYAEYQAQENIHIEETSELIELSDSEDENESLPETVLENEGSSQSEHIIQMDFTLPAVDILGKSRDVSEVSAAFRETSEKKDGPMGTEIISQKTDSPNAADSMKHEEDSSDVDNLDSADLQNNENHSGEALDLSDFYNQEEEQFLQDPFSEDMTEEIYDDAIPADFSDAEAETKETNMEEISDEDTEEDDVDENDDEIEVCENEMEDLPFLENSSEQTALSSVPAECDKSVVQGTADSSAEFSNANFRAETTSAAVGEQLSDAVVSVVPSRPRGRPYSVPAEGLLTVYPDGAYWIIDEDTQKAAQQLKNTLSEFKIEAEVTGIRKGPVITMFEILPAPGVKLSKIVNLQDNIALRLAASSVRIVAPIPGKSAVGIEVPNKERAIVSFRELIDTDASAFRKMAVPVVLGKDITGEAQIIDLTKTPHLLIAGSTGSGKSVCVNSMILSILYKRSPQEVKMILIDPKVVELKLYNEIPHLLTPVITEPKKAFQALQYCLCEMERRYALLDGMGVRDISSYNRRIAERNIAAERLPYIVVVIDEFADLMATTGKELESTLARLAAMSRAVGIHLVLATQRPSIDVITGLIKANIPSRIAFMVASKMDSRIIIDQIGAEKLLGKGDMLYASATDPFPVRIQGTFISDNEVENVVDYVKQYGEPEYIDDEIFVDDEDDEDTSPALFGEGEDPLYDKALDIVVQAGKASASYIQRRLKIGYNRAARLIEEMEARGLVGPQNGSKPREIIHVP